MPVTNIEPIVFSPSVYINGCELQWVDDTTVSISTGLCRDQSNTIDIPINSPITLSTTTVGANGLDIGTLSNNQVYFVYIVADATSLLQPTAVFSLNRFDLPVMPLGYTSVRRVGRIRTDSSGNILKFYSYADSGSDRFIQLDEPLILVSSGSATSFTNFGTGFSASNDIPSPVFLEVEYTPIIADHFLGIRPFGSTALIGGCPINIGTIDFVVTNVQSMLKILPQNNNGTSTLQYAVTGAGDVVSIYLVGFIDRL